MHPWLRRVGSLLFAVLAVVVGAFAGAHISRSSVFYRATVSFPWESRTTEPGGAGTGATVSGAGSRTTDAGATVFKEIEPFLFSVDSLTRYAQFKGLEQSDAVAVLRSQFANGLRSPLAIERIFSIDRTDARNLPDLASRDMFKEVASRIQITATASSEVSARQLADVGRDYAIQTLLRTRLYLVVQDALLKSKAARARAQHDIANLQVALTASERQIAAMEALRDKFKDATPSAGEPGTGTGETVTLTNNETRYLSPVRQLIGAESARAGLIADIGTARRTAIRAEFGERFAGSMLSLFATNDDGAELLKKAFSELDRVGSASHAEDEALVLRDARTEIERSLVDLQIEFVDYKPYSAEASISRGGTSRSLAMLVGMAVGLALWWIVVHLRSYATLWLPGRANSAA
jgi:hypothetical protein